MFNQFKQILLSLDHFTKKTVINMQSSRMRTARLLPLWKVGAPPEGRPPSKGRPPYLQRQTPSPQRQTLGQTYTCKNITFSQLRLQAVNIAWYLYLLVSLSDTRYWCPEDSVGSTDMQCMPHPSRAGSVTAWDIPELSNRKTTS